MARGSGSPISYEPSIDGLRFIAFLLVLIHHAPQFPGSEVLTTIKSYGWVGVEIFFALSSYLLFRNLIAESDRRGQIDIRSFFFRRILRIYPLLLTYLILVTLVFGISGENWFSRLFGVLFFYDNLMTWVDGYNSAFAATAHLWTLSFEFQVYFLIPFAFIFFKKKGLVPILFLFLVIALVSAMLRWFYGYSVPHPAVYTTPVFRPESALLGMLLAAYRPRWHYLFSVAIAVASIALVISIPRPWEERLASLVQYSALGLMSASVLDASIRCPWLNKALSWRPIVSLGLISYGLYVFHYFTRQVLRVHFNDVWIYQNLETSIAAYAAYTASIFLMALVLSVVSYRLIEKPFLKLGKGFSGEARFNLIGR